jgi:shikimate kinase
VGLPGSGKSTVGALAAAELGLPVVDIDALIERRVGRPIDEIFAREGEAWFRAEERDETARALKGEPSVVVPGGGGPVQPGNLDGAKAVALTVYLETTPATAASRVAGEVGRPLLAGDEPLARMRALLVSRGDQYQRCDVTVSTDERTPVEVAREVAELARGEVGD